MARRDGKKGAGIIIRKTEEVHGAHHGGAWKVAYADFVTAMMAFFLLMWLLNATTEAQRKGLADYFSPSNLMSHASSGSGEPFGGHTPYDNGELASDRGTVQVTVGKRPVVDMTDDGDDPVSQNSHHARQGDGVGRGPVPDDMDQDDKPDPNARGQSGRRQAVGPGGPMSEQRDGQPLTRTPGDVDLQAAMRQAEKASFERAAQQIKDAVRNDPALAELSKQLAVDMTPQGLRIQIMDEVKLPMFPSGSSVPNERTRLLIQKIVPVLMKLNKSISIAGHTDAQPFPGPGRTNWELSTERANATRRLLVEGGFPDARVQSVTGHADREPLLPNDPMAAANRRIAIMVLHDPPPAALPQTSASQASTPPAAITH
ncbi:MAG TPA: flagellar motor protein MotB [Rhodopila sp.]|uniref:flagellar motor protein MotB n=1 Tax=Rhodopila sp. TaxID=2480087 RepID=UPI002BDC42C4|nr:flagellar motor protein MotB [Rhodopila sp.]HVY16477.1 flagellar motor protein MotB [Rhodopila sp.]